MLEVAAGGEECEPKRAARSSSTARFSVELYHVTQHQIVFFRRRRPGPKSLLPHRCECESHPTLSAVVPLASKLAFRLFAIRFPRSLMPKRRHSTLHLRATPSTSNALGTSFSRLLNEHSHDQMQARALPLLIHRGSPTCLLCFRSGIAPSRTSRVSQLLSPRCRIPSDYHVHSTNDASVDLNPIQTNPYFAAYASLPGTITHGMFSVLLLQDGSWRLSWLCAFRIAYSSELYWCHISGI